VVVQSLAPVRLFRADVVVNEGRVAEAGQVSDGGPGIDCSGCLIVPGNVCAHTHLYAALARGMPYALDPPTTFLQILQRVWWRLDRALDEDAIRASARVGGMEALLSGTTTVIDHHASPNAIDGALDVIADALEELGIRSVICYEVTDRDGREGAEAGLRENERFLGETRRVARGTVGAHASFTLSEETLAACVEIAHRHHAGIHIHMAEDGVDEHDCEARFGTRVAERLARAGALHQDSILAHCVHLDDAEIDAVRASRASVVHNPTSNMNNAVGHAPIGKLEDALALGTDGIGADMFAESRAAHFRAQEDGALAGVQRPLDWLARGAQVAGAYFGEPALGRIERAAPADLVVLDYSPPTPLDAANLAGHWLFGIGAAHVRDVVVDGRLVVEGGRLTSIDQEEITAEAMAAAPRLWERMEALSPHPFDPAEGW
jgi:putative selenium metabolism protein SsnA